MSKHNIKPIQSQKEADKVLDYLIKQTSETLKISIPIATVRVKAMLEWTREMKVNPLTDFGKMMIDRFLQKPQPNEENI